MNLEDMRREIQEIQEKRQGIEELRMELKENPEKVVDSFCRFWWDRKIDQAVKDIKS